MKKTFSKDGHNYTVIPVENSDELTIIRDGRFTKRTSNMALYNVTNDNVQSIIANLFEQ